jgi:uncharacterized integral membrane protein
MSYNKLRLPVFAIILAQFPLIKFALISKVAGGMVIYVCMIVSFVFLILESIQDKEISISGSSIVKVKNPKTYWVVLASAIILTTVMTAILVFSLFKGPTH